MKELIIIILGITGLYLLLNKTELFVDIDEKPSLRIKNILEKYNLEKKYSLLLYVYSILDNIDIKKCSNDQYNEELYRKIYDEMQGNDLLALYWNVGYMHPKLRELTSVNTLKHIPLTRGLFHLLNISVYIIEETLLLLNDIPFDDIQRIKDLNGLVYLITFNQIIQACSL